MNGNLLSEIRRGLNLSQANLGKSLGVSQAKISRCEQLGFADVPKDIEERMVQFISEHPKFSEENSIMERISQGAKAVFAVVIAALHATESITKRLGNIWSVARVFLPEPGNESNSNSPEFRQAQKLKKQVEFLFAQLPALSTKGKSASIPEQHVSSYLEVIETLCAQGIAATKEVEGCDFLNIKFRHNLGLATHLKNEPSEFDSAELLFRSIIGDSAADYRDIAFACNELAVIALKRFDVQQRSHPTVETIALLEDADKLVTEAAAVHSGNGPILETLLDVADRYFKVGRSDDGRRVLAAGSTYFASLSNDSLKYLERFKNDEVRANNWKYLSKRKGLLRKALPWFFIALLAWIFVAASSPNSEAFADSNVNTRELEFNTLLK